MKFAFHGKLRTNQLRTRNTLTQASKNGRKPFLFPQKKFVSVFYAINIFNIILMPRSMHLHTEIYPNLKSISE